MKLSKRIVLAILFLIHVGWTALAAKTKAKKVKKTKFFTGKFPPGKFEYPELNGLHTPKEAVQLCEEDLQCAGFSFKGSPQEEQKYLTHFFHFIPKPTEKRLDLSYLEWSTYRNKRPFLAFSGVPEEKGTKVESVKAFTNVLQSSIKAWEQFKWPLEMPVVSFNLKESLGSAYPGLDLGQFKFDKETRSVTFFNLNSQDLTETHAPINRCCKTNPNPSIGNMISVDEVDNVRCDILNRQFEAKYEIQRQPVVLTNCAATCSKLNWTVSDLIHSFEKEVTWSARVAGSRSIQGDPLKILEVLSAEEGKIRSISGEFTGTSGGKMLVLVLDHEEAHFGPNVRDLRHNIRGKDPKIEFIMLSENEIMERTTGKLVSDVKFTLISGNVSWILLPMDFSTFKLSLSCDKKCSGSSGNEHWHDTIFPQIKTRFWNGRRPLIVHQRPGDTLYVPGDWTYLGLGHKTSTMIQEEFVSFQSLADVAKIWPQGDLYKLKKVLGSHDDYRKEFRKFNSVLNQIAKDQKKSKSAS